MKSKFMYAVALVREECREGKVGGSIPVCCAQIPSGMLEKDYELGYIQGRAAKMVKGADIFL